PSHKASHPGLFEVHFAPGEFMSSLHASRDFAEHEKICQISGWSVAPSRTRTSFQCGPYEHLEFNTDVVFANHSCALNTALNISSPVRDEWCLLALRDIRRGEEITWFHPSTEWDAWRGGFACQC
ncbi:hypothetical protein C8J57DRAFT_968808, partial [Mycena rebaudengoi]